MVEVTITNPPSLSILPSFPPSSLNFPTGCTIIFSFVGRGRGCLGGESGGLCEVGGFMVPENQDHTFIDCFSKGQFCSEEGL